MNLLILTSTIDGSVDIGQFELTQQYQIKVRIKNRKERKKKEAQYLQATRQKNGFHGPYM